MIRVYYYHTPNVFKVLIALEEMGLTYEEVPLNILNDEQFQPSFLAISPNNKLPVIEDLDPADGNGSLAVFESGAILEYLAEKSGKLLPMAPRAKAEVMQWVFWQAANQGPHMGLLGHYRNFAAEQVPYAIDRHSKEVARQMGVLDRRLADRDFIAGEYSIADITCYPWLRLGASIGIPFDDYPNIRRWFDAMSARPAVKAALSDARVSGLAAAVEASRPR